MADKNSWYCVHKSSIVSETDTTATVRVECYWVNNGWTYNINYVSAWVYCYGQSYQVMNSGNVNAKSSATQQLLLGYHDFVVSKALSSKTVEVYAKITSDSSYTSGTKSSAASTRTISAKTSYKVTYNANGGSGAPSAQTKWYGTTLSLSSTKPTRTGYAFKGWATSASSATVSYAAGASYTKNAALTLYAVWQANTYTVSYNANGGSGAPSSQTKTYGVTLTLSSEKPTRTNYTFKGWGKSASSTTVSYAAGSSYTSNSAITLYAVWELAYVKPRITDLVVGRCDSEGNWADDGTYIKTSFNWSCDKTISAISVGYKVTSDSGNTYTNKSVSGVSGTSGSVVDFICGDGSISTEKAYTVSVLVDDASDLTIKYTNVPSLSIPLDFTPTGDGCGIGMPATESGVLNIAHKTYLNGGLGMVKLTAGTDLDTVTTANFYACLAVSQYTNAPPFPTSNTFTLEVLHPGQDAQIIQRAVACNDSYYIIAVRNYYASKGWGDWNTKIRGDIESCIWVNGRYGALLSNTNAPTKETQYLPLTSIKTLNGAWTTGIQYEKYHITYTSNDDYNSGTNNKTHGLVLESDGTANFYKAPWVNVSSGDAYWYATAGNYTMGFGVGSGQVNRGIYDSKRSQWLINNDASNTYIRSIGTIQLYADTDASTATKAVVFGNAGSGHPLVYPATNCYGYLGGVNYRWYNIYTNAINTTNAVTVSSDARLKEDISDDFSKLEAVFPLLRPVTYKMKNTSDDKLHMGFVAQEVKEAFEVCDIDPDAIAFLTKDEVEPDEVFEDGISYGLGYTELIALNTYVIQKQQDIINKQENRIADLESRLAKLETLFESINTENV